MMGDFEEAVEANADEWNALLHRVYSHGAPDGPPQPPEPGERRFLVRDHGRPVSACRVRAYTVARGVADIPCGGVAAVGTLVQDRRKGHSGDLMRGVLAAMREGSQPLAALYPYQPGYYAQFGFALSGWQWAIDCPRDSLPAFPPPTRAVLVPPSAWKRLEPAYLWFARSRSGCLLRRPEEWARRLEGAGKEVYAVGDPVRGYAVTHSQGAWGRVQVSELVYTDVAAYEALLGLLLGLCANQNSVRWSEPPDGPFLAQYLPRGATAAHSGATMFRVVDVPSALRLLRPEGSGEFALRLHDPEADWNTGVWRVRWSREQVEVEPGGEAGIELDPGALAQAFMGSPSMAGLIGQGRVRALDPAQAREAARFFGFLHVSMLDTF